ncbi:hypothetical protein [Variovorax sp. PAMC 28711]|uniref:hypothetical protein n=1 Tax=Variovorax sp. PAMC 28711 TaxID=1795631 RepID=UPI00078B40DC|nr:hypothetical protein [Variovorax sp. PAMC 28711]AMM25380.1 hypothetical protein AX767_14165 [Variovorax sp. PAMC 28711]
MKTKTAQAVTAVFLMAIGICLAPAAAQSSARTWRCGNTYTDQPCQGGKTLNVDDSRSDADRRAAESATRRNEKRADELERSRVKLDRDVAERDRKAAAEARRAELAERKLASAEKLQQARIRKMGREPRKSTKAFKSAAAPSGG